MIPLPRANLGQRLLILPLLLAPLALAHGAEPEIVSVEKIWNQGGHNAFTDLIRFQDKWYCTFREAAGHIRGNGKIRVLESSDSKQWTSAALLEETGIDLRDPKLSIMPDGRLMVVAGGSDYGGANLGTNADGSKPVRKRLQPRVAFSADGRTWTPTERILREGQWLWRVTWFDGRAYGIVTDVSMRSPEGPEHDQPGTPLELITSIDGVHWETITKPDVPNRPHESTIRFFPDGEMMALVRCNVHLSQAKAWIGTSQPPYKDWAWRETAHFVGGPDFVILPDGQIWGGGRCYEGTVKKVPRTTLARMTRESFDPVLTLPSGGDTSYPGFAWHDGLLWMSYYSSHEGKTSIYLAKIKLPDGEK